MAANVSVPNNFVAGSPAVADHVDANFTAIVNWINTNAVHLDASKAFTSVPSGPAGADPTSADQLTRKAYVDGLALPTAWTGVAFQNSWVNSGGAVQGVQFRKIGDLVYLRGSMKDGLVNFAAFTLPSGFRPPATLRFGNADSGIVQIDSAGVVTAFQASNAIFSFDGVVFSITS